MSRGLGTRQREILAALAVSPAGAELAVANVTHSESVALRRAARTLQARGLVAVAVKLSASRRRMTVTLPLEAAAA